MASPRTLPALASLAGAALLLVAACGGDRSAPAVSPAATASAIPSAPPSAVPSTPPDVVSVPGPSAAASVAPPPVPTSAVATSKTEPSWAKCHQSFKAKARDVSKDVEAMAKGCEGTTHMKVMGKTLTGSQADSDVPQKFPLEAKEGRCYRVYAQASDGIQDLDVVIKDSAGVIVGQDATDGPSPVVLEDGAVCFSKPDKATLVVSVGMGKGSYALQVWESP